MRYHTDSSKNDVLLKDLTVLCRCYSTGYFEDLFPLLSEDAVMESQWVFQPNTGKQAVVAYYTGKGQTLRSHNCCPDCDLIQLVGNMNRIENADIHTSDGKEAHGSVGLLYPDGKYAMLMRQTLNGQTNGVVVDLTLDENDMIARIDLCMPELFRFRFVEPELPEESAKDPDMDTEDVGEHIPDDDEIEAHIRELFANAPDDFDAIGNYISEVEEYYTGDLDDFAFREAIRSGAEEYVDEKAGEFDLNDEGAYSTYLYETDDPAMQDILIENGAFRSWDDYADYRFAVETVNGEILAFDDDFREEVFAKYLEFTGLTEEKVIEMLSDGYDADEDEDLPEGFDRFIDEDFTALGIYLGDGEICFRDLVGDGGSDTKELLEELGYDCDFEGDSWKLETNGVYFIK